MMFEIARKQRGGVVFKLGDRFVYGSHGVCQILDIEQRIVDRKAVDYLVLSPVEQVETRFYVPVHSESATAKLHPLLTKEELVALFQSDAEPADVWIPSDNLRKQSYRTLIANGDRYTLVAMIRLLYKHRENQVAAGKKFHQSDDNFLRDAQKLLSSEVSVVFGISQVDAIAYIKNELCK